MTEASGIPWSRPGYADIAALVADFAGLRLPRHRQEEVEALITRAAGEAGAPNVEQFAARLASDSLALGDLVSELTIGETYFLRDLDHLELIRDRLVPEVLARRGPAHQLRAWSAGCSTGEEAWSVAMLLADAGLAGRARIVGTDIARPALARARQGFYREWSLRGTGRRLAERYLEPAGDGWLVPEALRKMVRFEYLNLAEAGYPSFPSGIWGMDLILCRNVFIYFDRALVERIARRLHDALAEGGWLLTAATDPSLRDLGCFEVEQTPVGTIYRRGAAVARPAPLSRRPPSDPVRQVVRGLSSEPPAPEPSPPGVPLTERVAQAYERGDYHAVVEVGDTLLVDESTACLLIRSLDNLGEVEVAERRAQAAVASHPLAVELHFLRVLLLMELGRWDEALDACRRVLYLDRTLVVAHLALGAIQRRRDRKQEALLAYRNARKLAELLAPDAPAPLADGQVAGRLAALAAAQLSLLESAPPGAA